MTDEPEMTLAEAAARLRLNPETIRRWLKAGRLRGYRPGGTKAGWRIRASDLEAFKRRAAGEQLPEDT